VRFESKISTSVAAERETANRMNSRQMPAICHLGITFYLLVVTYSSFASFPLAKQEVQCERPPAAASIDASPVFWGCAQPQKTGEASIEGARGLLCESA